MTGVLYLWECYTGQLKQGTRFGYKPFRAPVLYHDIFAGLEGLSEIPATICPSGQYSVQESVWVVLGIIYQYVFGSGIEQDNTVSIPSYTDRLLSCSNSSVASGPKAV